MKPLFPGIENTPENIDKMRKVMYTEQKMLDPYVIFGKIYIRTLTLEKKGQFHQGHRHHFDHVTNLIKGSVLCEVDGCEPKTFEALSMITIVADKWHKFTALEDDVVYQCIFHQPERKDLFGVQNSPYGYAPFTKEELHEQFAKLDACSDCSNCK